MSSQTPHPGASQAASQAQSQRTSRAPSWRLPRLGSASRPRSGGGSPAVGPSRTGSRALGGGGGGGGGDGDHVALSIDRTASLQRLDMQSAHLSRRGSGTLSNIGRVALRRRGGAALQEAALLTSMVRLQPKGWAGGWSRRRLPQRLA